MLLEYNTIILHSHLL